jgi:catechol 2,3-dioxygenase-like lactoylglutathione lyase family enzyme
MAICLEGSVPLLQVFDMPTSLAFYRDVIGFEVVERSAPGDDCDWVWLRLDSAEIMLNTAYEHEQRPPAPDPARVAGHADTTVYFGCRDLDAAYDTLRSRGMRVPEPVIQDYGMEQLYLSDPDGYGLCFQRHST